MNTIRHAQTRPFNARTRTPVNHLRMPDVGALYLRQHRRLGSSRPRELEVQLQKSSQGQSRVRDIHQQVTCHVDLPGLYETAIADCLWRCCPITIPALSTIHNGKPYQPSPPTKLRCCCPRTTHRHCERETRDTTYYESIGQKAAMARFEGRSTCEQAG